MNDLIFLLLTGFLLINFLGWGFKHLPHERWQMLAVVPVKKGDERNWHGANLTYYGFFVATSQMISLTLLLILLGAMKISFTAAALAIVLVLSFSVPAARLVACVVEKKRHTFTIGGASFVGIIVAPLCIFVTNSLLHSPAQFLPVIPVMAAMSISYTLGEGLGRLGCISYGCCYGKPLSSCNSLTRYLFKRTAFIFHGELKKVAYEAQLDGERLVPIQAITCILYCTGALLGSYLFLQGYFVYALLFTISLTQLWRIISEGFRADFRGFGKISVYQKMGLLSVIYTSIVASVVHTDVWTKPEVAHGITALWTPLVILGLQLLWIVFFYIFGRSTITNSTISFDLNKGRI